MSELNLSLVITKVGHREALEALEDLDAAGRRIVNSVSGATGHAMGDVASAYRRAGVEGQDAFRSVAVRADMAAEATKRLAAAQEKSGNAAGGHGLQLGRLRMELGTLFGRLTGTNTALDRMGGAIGAMGLGDPAVIAALAGAAALAAAWHAWHEEGDKAKEQQDKLTESLTKWYKVQKQGVAGALPEEIKAMTAHVKELRTQLDGVMEGKFFSGLGAVGAGGSKGNAWLRIFTAGDLTAITTQFRLEMAKGVAAETKDIKEGGAAIVAANKEVAQRIQDEADKEAKKAHDAMVKRFDALLKQRSDWVKATVSRLTNADDPSLDPIERLNRNANRGDKPRNFLDGWLPTPEEVKEEASARMIAIQMAIKEIAETNPIILAGEAAKELGMRLGDVLKSGIADGLAGAFESGFKTAFAGGGAVGFIKGFGEAVLGALGGIMERLGAALVSYGVSMELVSAGLSNPITSGPAAIAAGALLIGLGAALGAAVSGRGGATTGGGYSYSSSSSSVAQIIDRGIISPDSYSSRQASSVPARMISNDTWNFYGPNDPQAVRWLDEVDRKRQQRGSLAGA